MNSIFFLVCAAIAGLCLSVMLLLCCVAAVCVITGTTSVLVYIDLGLRIIATIAAVFGIPPVLWIIWVGMPRLA